jgi:MFS family permease
MAVNFSDMFGAEDRHVVSAMVSFGMGAGISVGQAVAGYLGPTFGWRLPFLVVSIPALVCALVVYFTVQDPPRGGMERAVLERQQPEEEGEVALVPSSSWSSKTMPDPGGDGIHPLDPADVSNGGHFNRLSERRKFQSSRQSLLEYRNSLSAKDSPVMDEHFDEAIGEHYESFGGKDWAVHLRSTLKLLSTPTVLLSLLQGAPGCVPWGIINVFLNDYLSEDRGFSVQMATTTLMCFSLGYTLGLVVGGMGGRYLYQMNCRLPALLAGSTAIMGCFPLWILLNSVDASTPYYISVACAMVAGLGSAPTGPIIKATLTNVTLPRNRGQAFALFNVFDDFGKGLGPFFVSRLIVQYGGRLPAFNVGVLGWVVCGVANLAIFFTVARDEGAVQATLAAEFYSRSSAD